MSVQVTYEQAIRFTGNNYQVVVASDSDGITSESHIELRSVDGELILYNTNLQDLLEVVLEALHYMQNEREKDVRRYR